MSLYLLQSAVEDGLIYGLVALGLLVSYKILGIADMTTDGSFVLGAAVSSVVTMAGHPILALPLGLLAGMLAGMVTAFLQTKLGVPSILAGIITMTGLYTINLLVQGGSANLFYSNANTLFVMVETVFGKDLSKLIVLLSIVAVVSALLILFFMTQLGLSIRATGDNKDMVQASSINPAFTTTVGLAIANGLIALAGALLAQKNTQGDINIGTGVVVIGLASLVLGGVIFKDKKIPSGIVGAVVGAIGYRVIFAIALKYTPDPGYLKIVSAAIVAVVIAYPTIKHSIEEGRKRGKRNA